MPSKKNNKFISYLKFFIALSFLISVRVIKISFFFIYTHFFICDKNIYFSIINNNNREKFRGRNNNKIIKNSLSNYLFISISLFFGSQKKIEN